MSNQGHEGISDFRSDTVTRPSPAMRQAMADAVVGDDGFGDDPTVLKLEGLAAEMTGKEAALFTPSGCMANQIALCVHGGAGDEALCEESSHIPWFEGAGAAVNARMQIRSYRLEEGILSPERAEGLLRMPIIDCPRTRVLCVENTFNLRGGVIWPLENLRELKVWAEGKGIAVHLDGARLFNAAVASGDSAAEIAACADSVMFCLSKGLGAPVGSMLCATKDFVAEARRWRKRLGGQLRQVGVLAAAGLIALQEGVDRLKDDHALIRKIADGLRDLPGLRIAQDSVDTNILLLGLPPEREADDVVKALAEEKVWLCPFSENRIRVVSHLDVGPADADRLIEAMGTLMG